MIVSDQYKFVFVHVPKTGGSSISRAIKPLLTPADQRHPLVSRTTKHEPYSALEERLESAGLLQRLLGRRRSLADYYKFAFVRNPWDRMVSLYHYLKGRTSPPRIDADQSFADFVRAAAEGEPWIAALHSMRPQIDFLIDASGRMAVDEVGRFERLAEDFKRLTARVGLTVELPHVNRSSHRPYGEYYDPVTRDIVGRLFARDAETWGYRP